MINNRSDNRISQSGSRIKGLYNHYKERGLFKYVGRNVLMIVVAYVIFVFLVSLIGKYLIDFNSLFQGVINSLSDRFVIILFFVSESFTGMVPVDLFALVRLFRFVIQGILFFNILNMDMWLI